MRKMLLASTFLTLAIGAAGATTISPGSGSITDASGNVWLITASGSIQKNGQWVAGGGGTSALTIAANGVVFGEDAHGRGWFTLNGAGQYWTPSSAPAGVVSTDTATNTKSAPGAVLPNVPAAPAALPAPAVSSATAATTSSCAAPKQAAFGILDGKIYTPQQTVFVPHGINLYDNNMPAAGQVLGAFPGINFIRLDVYSYQDPSAYQAFVNQMTAAGVVVEFEDHTSSDGQNRGGSTGSVFTGAQLSNELAWYSAMAKAYASNPYVWYGTDNEPPGGAGLSDWQLQTYNAIRSGSPSAVIMLEMNCDTSGCGSGYVASDYANMTNVVWDPHFYGWVANYSTDQGTVASALASEIASAQRITSAGGAVVPVIIGEFGNSTDGATVDPDGTQVVAAVLSSGYGYAAWNWASGAPADNLTSSGGGLTAYGQQVAAGVAATSSGAAAPTGSTGCAVTQAVQTAVSTSAITSTAQPTAPTGSIEDQIAAAQSQVTQAQADLATLEAAAAATQSPGPAK